MFFLRIIRILLRGISGFILLICLYVAIAFICCYIPVNRSFHNSKNGIEIFLDDNGVHTDLVLPVNNLRINWKEKLMHPLFREADSSFHYVAFGWGDKQFYIETPYWSDLKFSTALKALFFMNTTAIHTAYMMNAPALGKDCKRLLLSTQQYDKLVNYILQSFKLDKRGQVIPVDELSYGNNDAFYEAKGKYSLIKTCNEWTSEALRTAGVTTAFWSPFTWGVMRPIS